MKMKINLFDSLSAHTPSLVGWRTFSNFFKPEKIEWIDDPLYEYDGVTVFTDKHILSPVVEQVSSKYKVAWIYECRAIHPEVYEYVHLVQHKFDYIFTFDETLLKRGKPYTKNLFGTTRIKDCDAQIYPKNKNLCLIASQKKYAQGHKIRHAIADTIGNRYEIDLYGRKYKEFPEGAKVDFLKDYRFEITLENSKLVNYFTEKIIDAFRVGTVPIYWGCPNISDFFNPDGIIAFNSGKELKNILNDLSLEEYNCRMPAIRENFELAKKWRIRDDILCDDIIEAIEKNEK